MQKNLLQICLDVLHSIFPSKTCLLIGSGRGSYVPIFKELGYKNVILVEADKRQIDYMYKMHELPSSYIVENTLIYKDEKELEFNVASNHNMSCFKTFDTYKSLMPNISLVKTVKKDALSLESFIENMNEDINYLIIDTFTSYEILSNSIDILDSLDVIICKVMFSDEKKLKSFILNHNFLLTRSFNENNPEIKIFIFIKNIKKDKENLKIEILEKQNHENIVHMDNLKKDKIKSTLEKT
ncbi:MAG TPA: hypothetical protein EYG72_00590, partial [Candidatus Pacebacteria bacterium]|nr:hypothetical protein [Candidatus Paceibacterota bacterium]